MAARFLVMGCGGLGGVMAARLLQSGHDVTVVTTNAAVRDAVNLHGIRLRESGPTRAVPCHVCAEVPSGPFDFALLATQPTEVEAAARLTLPALAERGVMVALQNGLCEARVAAIGGEERTMGCVVWWGAAMPEPGVYERTSPGGFTLGRMDGSADPRIHELARALAPLGAVEITDNLEGKRWSKLAFNCAITPIGTIGGERLGALFRRRYVRRIALEVMTEVVRVALEESVRFEKLSGVFDLEWLALTAREQRANGSPRLVAKHALVLAFGFRFRRLRSSMLAAIERGRPPAVDFLNGEVVERARTRGLAVPMNEALRDTVWQIARGAKRPHPDLLASLFDATGALRGHRLRALEGRRH
jgi:2-dehydropantoate 2-reductase